MDRWKAAQGRGRKKRKIRREKSRRERVRRKKMQMREKVGKSRNTVFFQWFVAPGGRKLGRLAKAAGAEPSGQRRDEKLHAVVARSTFGSQNVQNTSAPDHFLEVELLKSAARSTCPSQNVQAHQNTPLSEHFWKLIREFVKSPRLRLVFHDPPWAIFSFHSKNVKRKKTITLHIDSVNDLCSVPRLSKPNVFYFSVVLQLFSFFGFFISLFVVIMARQRMRVRFCTRKRKVPGRWSLHSFFDDCSHLQEKRTYTGFTNDSDQYYFVLQSLHKALPSTTLYYKACTKHFPVLLCKLSHTANVYTQNTYLQCFYTWQAFTHTASF